MFEYALRLLLMSNVGNTLYEALSYSPSFPLHIFIITHISMFNEENDERQEQTASAEQKCWLAHSTVD